MINSVIYCFITKREVRIISKVVVDQAQAKIKPTKLKVIKVENELSTIQKKITYNKLKLFALNLKLLVFACLHYFDLHHAGLHYLTLAQCATKLCAQGHSHY